MIVGPRDGKPGSDSLPVFTNPKENPEVIAVEQDYLGP
jgi:hypothetical protein